MINRLVWENLKHRPIRTLLSAVAIGVQVTMILTLAGVSRGMLEDSAKRTRGVGADILVRPPNSSIINLTGAPMPEKVVDKVRAVPHVAVATGVEIHGFEGIKNITGIDIEKFTEMNGGFRYIAGGPFQNDDDIIVDEYYARQNHLKAGSTMDIINKKWHVRGIVESGKLARTCVRLKVLQDITGNTGRITMIYVKADEPAHIGTLIETLKQELPSFQIYSMDDFLSQISISNIPALQNFIVVIIGLSVVFGFLVVFLAMYTAVLERTREIGILKALGASPGFVLQVLVRETVLLSMLGSVFGILFTYGTRWAIMTLYPASLTQYIVYDWWPITTGVALTGALLGAIYPGLKAARQDTVEALTYE